MSSPENLGTEQLRPDREIPADSRLILPFWDISKFPFTNDADQKIGQGHGLYGAAVDFAGRDSRLRLFVDGISRPEKEKPRQPVSSISLLDPDNWVPRFYTPLGKGKGAPRHWSIRFIADHCNRAGDRSNRSTMVVDQSGSQRWGAFHELAWVVDLSAPVLHRELGFNGAAFLGLMYPDGRGGAQFTQGCLALNISRNSRVTDGSKIGSLAQILTFFGGGRAAGGGTVAGGGAGGGTGAGGGGCEPPSGDANLAINAHAPYKYAGGQLISWPLLEQIGETSEDGDEWKKVFFAEGPPGPDFLDVAEDTLSNQPKAVGLKVPQLMAAVKIKKHADDD